jgi:hypothetical protein
MRGVLQPDHVQPSWPAATFDCRDHGGATVVWRSMLPFD